MGKPSRPSSSHPFASHPLNGRKILQSALLAGLAAGAGAGAIVAVKSLLFPHRTYEQEKAYLESLRSKGEKPYREPGFLQRNPRVTVYDDGNDPRTEGMVTYRIGPAQLSVSSLEENQGEEVEGNRGEEADSGLTLLYLHGGTFLSTLSPHQARLLFRLTRMLKGQALVPEFPRMPFHTAKESLSSVTEIYRHYQADHPDRAIILLADSSGAALAMGLMSIWAKEGLPLPASVVLISPWLDLTMSHPKVKEYERKDKTQSAQALIADGECWAGDDDPADPLLSPSLASDEDLAALTPVHDLTIFIGENDLFYPDAASYAQRCEQAGITTRLFTEAGMPHDYPFLPLPQGRQAVRLMADMLSELAR